MNDDQSKKIDLLIGHAISTNSRLDSIDTNLAAHMKRSELLEERQELIEEEVKPLLEHFKGFKWALQALIGMTALIKIWDLFN